MNEGIEVLDKLLSNLFGKAFAGMAVVLMIPILGFILLLVVAFWLIKKQGSAYNKIPRIVAPATIVSKRTHISGSSTVNHGHSTHSYYYVTFQMESGDRMELHVPRNEVGLLVEGDHGMLTFQGSRYLSFERY